MRDWRSTKVQFYGCLGFLNFFKEGNIRHSFFIISDKFEMKFISDDVSTNRFYHQSPMQTEKSQSEGKRMMPETRFTEFPTLSIDQRFGIAPSASETVD